MGCHSPSPWAWRWELCCSRRAPGRAVETADAPQPAAASGRGASRATRHRRDRLARRQVGESGSQRRAQPSADESPAPPPPPPHGRADAPRRRHLDRRPITGRRPRQVHQLRRERVQGRPRGAGLDLLDRRRHRLLFAGSAPRSTRTSCRSRPRSGPRRWSTISPTTMRRRRAPAQPFSTNVAVFPSPWSRGPQARPHRHQGLCGAARPRGRAPTSSS